MSEPILNLKAGADARTTEGVLHMTLADQDEDVAWHAIAELQSRGDREVFEQACRLCRAKDARARRVGVDILGQLGVRFEQECMKIVLRGVIPDAA